MKTSPKAYELATIVINDGAGYPGRCELARKIRRTANNPTYQRIFAADWLQVATRGAQIYERQFGSPNASVFSAADILGAALELADYYAVHTDEIDRLKYA